MAGKLPGNPSQFETAKETPSIHVSEDHQCLISKWYFSRQEIEDHSPSRKDGIDNEKESQLRKLYCSFLQELGIELKVPQVTIATAMMLCHRFYMRQSHAKNDWQTIATVSMFHACKAEETPCWLSDVAFVAYKLMYRWDPSAPRRFRQREVYDKQKELIVVGERLLLSTVAFDMNIEHPYKALVAALKRLEISHKELAKVAWNFVNDWLRTTLCLQYKPHYIAAGSLCLAAKLQKVKLPSEKGKLWWMQFDVSPKLLEEVIQEMVGLLEKNRKQALPPTRGKVTESRPAVSKSMPNIPHSGSVSGSNVAQNTHLGAKANTEGLAKPAISNSPRSCTLSGSSVVGCTGLGVTVAASRVDKHVMSNNSPESCILGDPNVAVATSHGAAEDVGGPIKSAISSSSHSSMISSSNVAQDTGQGDVLDASGPSAMSKCNEIQASNDFHGCIKQTLCHQTSDCGSAISAVEEGDTEPRAGESNQNANLKTGSVQVGDCKIDVVRIRQALKSRRLDRNGNKKSLEAMDDEIDSEAWIERELENVVELESASANKRMRF